MKLKVVLPVKTPLSKRKKERITLKNDSVSFSRADSSLIIDRTFLAERDPIRSLFSPGLFASVVDDG